MELFAEDCYIIVCVWQCMLVRCCRDHLCHLYIVHALSQWYMQAGALPSAPIPARMASLDMSWLGRCSESLLTLDLTDCVALDVKVKFVSPLARRVPLLSLCGARVGQ